MVHGQQCVVMAATHLTALVDPGHALLMHDVNQEFPVVIKYGGITGREGRSAR